MNMCVMCGLPTGDNISEICPSCWNIFLEDIEKQEAEVYERWEKEEHWKKEMMEDAYGKK
jgi:hypothetical protein